MRYSEFLEYKDDGLYWLAATSKQSRISIGSRVGHVNSEGYRVFKFAGKPLKEHRVVWEMHYGEIPDGMEIDHENHIRDDNRIENLRAVKRIVNMKNTSIRKTNNSGFTGVSWCNTHGKWKAQIQVDGKKISLGYHANINEAIEARKAANVKYGFHENHGGKNGYSG